MRRVLTGSALAIVFSALGLCGFAIGAAKTVPVSQKGRAFVPLRIEIAADQSLTIHNDDEYVHDIFVQAADFDFESGEQQIGQDVVIKFPHPGAYEVLCAIHPKMRLNVSVQ